MNTHFFASEQVTYLFFSLNTLEILSFVFVSSLSGVREGTIIAALLVGFIARLFGGHLEFIKAHIFPE